MELQKNCHQVAYKPISVGNGIWMPSDVIDYNSRETKINKYNENGLLYYEIKNGFEEKTTFQELFTSAKYIHNINSSLVKKYTYHYELGAVLKKISYISWEDKFEQEHIEKEFFYEDESVICLHYLYDKPSYYEKTKWVKDKKIVEYWKHDKTPYQKYEYYYDAGRLITQVQINLPSNCIQQYWEHEYDKIGNCVAVQRLNHKRVAEHRELFEFDEYNNCVREQLVYKPTGSLVEDKRNLYEYDEQGNWIRKIMYKNNEIQCFVDNKIIE